MCFFIVSKSLELRTKFNSLITELKKLSKAIPAMQRGFFDIKPAFRNFTEAESILRFCLVSVAL
jgi:hypothetical protein